jgi:hypothetical protein
MNRVVLSSFCQYLAYLHIVIAWKELTLFHSLGYVVSGENFDHGVQWAISLLVLMLPDSWVFSGYSSCCKWFSMVFKFSLDTGACFSALKFISRSKGRDLCTYILTFIFIFKFQQLCRLVQKFLLGIDSESTTAASYDVLNASHEQLCCLIAGVVKWQGPMMAAFHPHRSHLSLR